MSTPPRIDAGMLAVADWPFELLRDSRSIGEAGLFVLALLLGEFLAAWGLARMFGWDRELRHLLLISVICSGLFLVPRVGIPGASGVFAFLGWKFLGAEGLEVVLG